MKLYPTPGTLTSGISGAALTTTTTGRNLRKFPIYSFCLNNSPKTGVAKATPATPVNTPLNEVVEFDGVFGKIENTYMLNDIFS